MPAVLLAASLSLVVAVARAGVVAADGPVLAAVLATGLVTALVRAAPVVVARAGASWASAAGPGSSGRGRRRGAALGPLPAASEPHAFGGYALAVIRR